MSFAFPNLAATFAAFQAGNASGNGTATKQQWFPLLDTCTTTPGCIGPREAIYNALDDLVARLSDPTLFNLAQTQIFNKLGPDRNGHNFMTADFISYLQNKRPRFYNGLASNYCFNSLRFGDHCFYYLPFLNGDSVSTYFANHVDSDATTGTPNNPLTTYFRPNSILFPSLGRNLGNEGLIFHEALHGWTGIFDQFLLEDFLGAGHSTDPSCNISVAIQNTVLSQSAGLDSTQSSCP